MAQFYSMKLFAQNILLDNSNYIMKPELKPD